MDTDEQEADRIADQVMCMSEPHLQYQIKRQQGQAMQEGFRSILPEVGVLKVNLPSAGEP